MNKRVVRIKKVRLSIAVFLLCIFSGCKTENDPAEEYYAEELKIDDRYAKVIDFEPLDIVIPLVDTNTFIRIDNAVSNLDAHQETILNELSIPLSKYHFHYSNEAKHGREMTLCFKDGKKCSFIWVPENDNPILSAASLNHEKYHALCKLSPESISILNGHIKTIGFFINLQDYDEELAATIIEILTINRSGVDLEQISGSELVTQAVEILKKAKELTHAS